MENRLVSGRVMVDFETFFRQLLDQLVDRDRLVDLEKARTAAAAGRFFFLRRALWLLGVSTPSA
jgi:hypothetical protein